MSLEFDPIYWKYHDIYHWGEGRTVGSGDRAVDTSATGYERGHCHLFIPGFDTSEFASSLSYSGQQTYRFEIEDVWGPNSNDPVQNRSYDLIGQPRWYLYIEEYWRRMYVQPWDVVDPENAFPLNQSVSYSTVPRERYLRELLEDGGVSEEDVSSRIRWVRLVAAMRLYASRRYDSFKEYIERMYGAFNEGEVMTAEGDRPKDSLVMAFICSLAGQKYGEGEYRNLEQWCLGRRQDDIRYVGEYDQIYVFRPGSNPENPPEAFMEFYNDNAGPNNGYVPAVSVLERMVADRNLLPAGVRTDQDGNFRVPEAVTGHSGIRFDASLPAHSLGPFREGGEFFFFDTVVNRTMPCEYWTDERKRTREFFMKTPNDLVRPAGEGGPLTTAGGGVWTFDDDRSRFVWVENEWDNDPEFQALMGKLWATGRWDSGRWYSYKHYPVRLPGDSSFVNDLNTQQWTFSGSNAKRLPAGEDWHWDGKWHGRNDLLEIPDGMLEEDTWEDPSIGEAPYEESGSGTTEEISGIEAFIRESIKSDSGSSESVSFETETFEWEKEQEWSGWYEQGEIVRHRTGWYIREWAPDEYLKEKLGTKSDLDAAMADSRTADGRRFYGDGQPFWTPEKRRHFPNPPPYLCDDDSEVVVGEYDDPWLSDGQTCHWKRYGKAARLKLLRERLEWMAERLVSFSDSGAAPNAVSAEDIPGYVSSFPYKAVFGEASDSGDMVECHSMDDVGRECEKRHPGFRYSEDVAPLLPHIQVSGQTVTVIEPPNGYKYSLDLAQRHFAVDPEPYPDAESNRLHRLHREYLRYYRLTDWYPNGGIERSRRHGDYRHAVSLPAYSHNGTLVSGQTLYMVGNLDYDGAMEEMHFTDGFRTRTLSELRNALANGLSVSVYSAAGEGTWGQVPVDSLTITTVPYCWERALEDWERDNSPDPETFTPGEYRWTIQEENACFERFVSGIGRDYFMRHGIFDGLSGGESGGYALKKCVPYGYNPEWPDENVHPASAGHHAEGFDRRGDVEENGGWEMLSYISFDDFRKVWRRLSDEEVEDLRLEGDYPARRKVDGKEVPIPDSLLDSAFFPRYDEETRELNSIRARRRPVAPPPLSLSPLDEEWRTSLWPEYINPFRNLIRDPDDGTEEQEASDSSDRKADPDEVWSRYFTGREYFTLPRGSAVRGGAHLWGEAGLESLPAVHPRERAYSDEDGARRNVPDDVFVGPVIEYQKVIRKNWERPDGKEREEAWLENNWETAGDGFGDGFQITVEIPYRKGGEVQSPFSGPDNQTAPIGKYFHDCVKPEKMMRYHVEWYDSWSQLRKWDFVNYVKAVNAFQKRWMPSDTALHEMKRLDEERYRTVHRYRWHCNRLRWAWQLGRDSDNPVYGADGARILPWGFKYAYSNSSVDRSRLGAYAGDWGANGSGVDDFHRQVYHSDGQAVISQWYYDENQASRAVLESHSAGGEYEEYFVVDSMADDALGNPAVEFDGTLYSILDDGTGRYGLFTSTSVEGSDSGIQLPHSGLPEDQEDIDGGFSVNGETLAEFAERVSTLAPSMAKHFSARFPQYRPKPSWAYSWCRENFNVMWETAESWRKSTKAADSIRAISGEAGIACEDGSGWLVGPLRETQVNELLARPDITWGELLDEYWESDLKHLEETPVTRDMDSNGAATRRHVFDQDTGMWVESPRDFLVTVDKVAREILAGEDGNGNPVMAWGYLDSNGNRVKGGKAVEFNNPYPERADGKWTEQCLGAIVKAKCVMVMQDKLGYRWQETVTGTAMELKDGMRGTDYDK